MADKQKSVPFYKEYWVSSIGVFLLSQIIFMVFDATGWNPTYRELKGVFKKLAESPLFTEWFTFYSLPHSNMLTVFFAIAFLVPGIISGIKSIFLKSS